ncbi:MAG: ABC transporter ATP-binding protein [Anaerolineae bacterium]|nr:MAG: ABC transporter ATP-binding protein [Anaerolineae bacterium]
METKPVVEATGLARIYRLGRSEVPALRGVNLRVYASEFVAIKGRSGSGKTTLLNIIGGLDRPDAGGVRLNGRDISGLAEGEMVALRRHQVGFVSQSFGLPPQYSAYETVEFTLRLAGLPRQERHERTIGSLSLVGLGERLHHRPDELSGGQQQRLCIARAIAIRPTLILADEPTGELDSQTGQEVLSLFRQIVALEEAALIVATHDPVVHGYATTGYELSDGRLTQLRGGEP